MKRLRIIICVSMVLGFLSACERSLTFNLKEGPPELVVLANFSDLDTLEVVVSKSRPVFDEEPVEYISDAVVEVYIDEFFADRLDFVPSPVPHIPPYFISSEVVPQSGDRLRLTVDAPGFEPVEGSSTMPFPVEIDTASTSLFVEIEELDSVFNLVRYTVDIKVLDPPGDNYYHLSFYQQGLDLHITGEDTLMTPFYSFPLITTTEDAIPFLPYIDKRGLLFTEDALDNEKGSLTFNCTFQYEPSYQVLGDFLIELRAGSPEYYEYHRSIVRQYQANLAPFTEPVILYSNIENGQGVFAAFVSRFYNIGY